MTIKTHPLVVNEIQFQGQKFKLNKPVSIQRIALNNKRWRYQLEELAIWGEGSSEIDAYIQLKQDFASTWNHIATEDDLNLNDEMLELKQALQDMVASVEA